MTDKQAELAACPLCGGNMQIYQCRAALRLQYKAGCTLCPFIWKTALSEQAAIEAHNSLCEDISIGRLIKAKIGDNREICGELRVNCEPGGRPEGRTEYIKVPLRDKAPKLTKDDVLRRWRAWHKSLIAIPESAEAELLRDTDAVLGEE